MSLKRNQPATQPLSRLDHRRFAEVRLWQETDVRMDPGNTTAAGTRKHAPETGMSRLGERKRLYTSRAPASARQPRMLAMVPYGILRKPPYGRVAFG